MKSGSKHNAELGDSNMHDDLLAYPEHERAILEDQVRLIEPTVTYMTLFRFAGPMEYLLYFVGFLCSIAMGASLPLMTLLFGNVTGEFSDFTLDPTAATDFQGTISDYSLYFVYLAIGTLVVSFASTFLTVYLGEILTNRIRVNYLKAVLRQNIAFFDSVGSGEITTRIITDTDLIQRAISEKVSVLVSSFAGLVSGVIIAIVVAWKIGLILTSCIFAILLAPGTLTVLMNKHMVISNAHYAAAGSSAEETISSIRNVNAFGLQQRLLSKYEVSIKAGEKAKIRAYIYVSLMVASFYFISYNTYALGFWQGSRYIASGEFDLSGITTAVLAILLSASLTGEAFTHARDMTLGVAAAKRIFATIGRQTYIDPESETGDIIPDLKGEIELKNVRFVYPSRPSVTVLKNMSLHVKPGQTVALVGMSGSGKSTIVGILERFYAPLAGEVLIDGHDIASLNVRWLRQQVALVSQEPVLFATTVFENIAYGLIGTEHESLPSEKKAELIHNAAKLANAYGFIMNLPEGFQTNVGERGFLMSGGQKQRIAIARAIVSNPKILLLDEATSALDTESEGIVQDALDKASESRTTIVIAHRLSTIKDADKIIVMKEGRIIESGTHNELIDMKGIYYTMVEAQSLHSRASDYSSSSTPKREETATSSDSEKAEILHAEEDQFKQIRGRHSSLSSSQMEELRSKNARTYDQSLFRIIIELFKMNKPESAWLVSGFVLAVITGAGYPVMSVFFAKVIMAFTSPSISYMRDQLNFWTGMIFMLSVVDLIGYTLMIFSMGVASEKLIKRLRFVSFKAILRQDISFFDRDDNSTGSLTSNLSKDGENAQGLGGSTLAHLLTSLVNLVAGCILGLVISWKLALVCIACVPVVLTAGFSRMWVLNKMQMRSEKVYTDSSQSACEATDSIRTVASLTRERQVLAEYEQRLDLQTRENIWPNVRSAVLYAFSYSMTLFVVALGFWWGGTLMYRGEISVFAFFVTFTAVVFGSQAAGSIFSFAPDMTKAGGAARNVLSLLRLEPSIDAETDEGIKIDDCRGDIDFVDVHFRYPTRPEVPVLRGLNLSVKRGQYSALVGTSGCGKSTVIGLVESYYRPQSGEILLDGIDLTKLNVKSYRSHLALVQQEPTLYSGSIRENILYGTEEDPENITDERLEEVCRMANIYDFIMSLPEGFETLCGSKGTLLSGGQKQRIAIARALIRDPKILLLDEATSALDSESEKVVQEALDSAAKGRTTIAVAHRLSTIKNADVIYVLNDGVVVESGTHDELIALKGRYAATVALQSLEES
ncbi:hypothetical protein CANCADRAFT_3056 [Tortispora caseinolytica NRRL Y-17796]|uniref:Uncharacterized protein n=1 Tax=Tortispora caseinolytica NRRL Y-17796 TaxID=767744 RepID=A0A1E4TI50_9ASCO|nr:hypothetical protein CANCADRAFT_3056 [Tortispora caseinolytica NRRL Y-17796]